MMQQKRFSVLTRPNMVGVIIALGVVWLLLVAVSLIYSLSCHAEQGHRLGEIRSGVDVMDTVAHAQAALGQQRTRSMVTHGLMGGLGLILLLAGGRWFLRDVEQHARAAKDLRQAHEARESVEKDRRQLETQFLRIQAAVDDAGDAVVILDCDRTVVYVNITFGELFQQTTESIAEAGIESIFKAPDQALEVFDEAVAGSNQNVEVDLIDGHENRFTALLRATVVLDDEFDIQGVLFIFTDITEQKEKENELRRIAELDGLTQIPNRRVFDATVDREWRRAQRSEQPLSLLMMDIDHFKSFNDNYGHQHGDECLKIVATTLHQAVRRSADLVARYGGEEFVVVLPETPIEGAMIVAELLRKAVESTQIKHAFSTAGDIVTVSIGVACMIPAKAHHHNELVGRADSALYAAKKSGRNCMRLYTLEIPE